MLPDLPSEHSVSEISSKRDRSRRRSRSAASLLVVLLLSTPVAAGSQAVPFRVIAHRGASAYAPENTLPAFEKALALGACHVELDVRLTRDGAVIVFHDSKLDHKTKGRGRLRDHDLAALRKLDIGAWFDATHPDAERRFEGTGLITLEELFDRFGSKLFYHVEIKSDEPELPGKVLALVRKAGLERDVRITSFDKEQLLRARSLDGEVPITLLVDDQAKLRRDAESGEARESASLETLQRRWVALAREARFDEVAFPSEEMTRDLVRHVHAQGLTVRAYRIRDRGDMEHAVAVGSNGMTINWPDWLLGDSSGALPFESAPQCPR